MITRENLLDFMANSAYRPLTQEELQEHFRIESEDLIEFTKLLYDMEQKGEIIFTRKTLWSTSTDEPCCREASRP